jgi:hypothetical protein
MNFTKLIESLEIFKKYAPHDEDASATDSPFDIDYCTLMVEFSDILIAPADVARLKEIGWSVQKYPSWGSQSRTVEEDEIGRYSIHFDSRDAFRAAKKAEREAESKVSADN